MAEDWSLLDKLIPGGAGAAAPAAAPAATPAPAAAAPAAAPAEDWSRLDGMIPGGATPPRAAIPTEQPSLLHPIDMVTGSRRTEFPDVPELTAGRVRELHGSGNPITSLFSDPAYRQVLIGYATAPNAEAQRDIVKSALRLPDDAFSQDRHGNWMATVQGERYYLNKPGFSAQEGLQLGRDAIIAGITRGGSLLPATANVALRAGMATGVNAGLSTAYDKVAQMAGSNEPVDAGRALVAGALGGLSEGAGTIVRAGINAIRGPSTPRGMADLWTAGSQDRTALTTGSLTPQGASMLHHAGIDPTLYSPDQQRMIIEQALLASPNPSKAILERAAASARQSAPSSQFGSGGIPRTTGQATGDLDQLAREEALRNGGGAPARTMREFDMAREQAANRAIANTREGVLFRFNDTPTPAPTLGDRVARDVTTAEANSSAAITRAYNAIPDQANVRFTAERTPELASQLRQAASSISRGSSARVNGILAEVEDLTATTGLFQGGHPPLSLPQVEDLRKKLVGSINAAKESDERTALIRMKAALDGWIDGAVDSGSHSAGTPEAVAALKTARAEARRHAELFEPDDMLPKIDSVLNVIRKGGSGTEITDAVLGTGTTLGNRGTAQTVEHLLRVAPDTRDTMREAVLNRLTLRDKPGADPSFRDIAQRLDDALANRGRGVMAALFNGEEQNDLRRLALELHGASQGAPKRDVADRLGAMLAGFAAKSGGGAAAGFAAGSALGIPGLGAATGAAAGAILPLAEQYAARRAARLATAPGQTAPPVDWRQLVPRQQRLDQVPAVAQGLFRTVPQSAAGLLMEGTGDRQEGLFP